jgi:sec-independent protein translocase protein TatB
VFSVSPAELLTIALVALIVFGPKRLPEISRKAGKVLRDLKETASELKAGLEAESGGTISALGDVRREMKSTLDALTGEPVPQEPAPDAPKAPSEE